MRKPVFVWDAFVRLFHWSLVLSFAANALITAPESKLHHWVGYVAVGLVVARILWGLIGTRHARFSDFPPDPAAALGQVAEMATGRRHAHRGHSPLGALMIYNLLLSVIVIGVSGYLMTTLAFFGVEWVEELHEAAVLWAEASVVLHILAVVFESRRLGINLPRSMVTGYKDMPET